MGTMVELAGGQQAPMAARLAVESCAAEVGPGVHADLRLLVSEVVTHSIRHGGAGPEDSLELELSISPERVRVEVSDPGHGIERRSPVANGEALFGDGLFIVDAVADRWGIKGPDGTRVWFELDRRTGRFERAAS